VIFEVLVNVDAEQSDRCFVFEWLVVDGELDVVLLGAEDCEGSFCGVGDEVVAVRVLTMVLYVCG
jgi:hypothetical protein